MISIFDYIQKYPRRAKQLLGINYDQFTDLVNYAKNSHEEEQLKLEQKKVRIHRRGGGRKELLSIPEQVCLCLFYLRQIPTFEVLGIMFGISKTLSNDTFHYWRKILRKILPSSLIEQVENKEGDLLIIQEILTNFKLLVDSVEQPIDRPSDNEEQKKFFSGKKKQHTIKNQIVSLPEGKDIIDVTVGSPGPTADIKLFREQQTKFDEKQEFTGDKAYQGGNNITTPHKKKRKQQLNEQQKEENKALSSKRIFVEHLIRIVKIFQVASQRFRLNADVYNEIVLLVCGLVRLRIGTFVLPNSAIN
ncbi:transposase [Tolypothrix sp. PCC 7910]|uniref:transposase family protein n=1 Tax=Tolypothrix sp. PCC 7910 TaxID=2099387 RepID=UPI00142788EE|nr:transposase family protein [Tolypothrix sp. PCC 7910]QIR35837.1 transposase [Tolypothrix sp. PCC 7910]QIR37178.1 transposase [Tolypothrix sp. PCC 7910]